MLSFCRNIEKPHLESGEHSMPTAISCIQSTKFVCSRQSALINNNREEEAGQKSSTKLEDVIKDPQGRVVPSQYCDSWYDPVASRHQRSQSLIMAADDPVMTALLIAGETYHNKNKGVAFCDRIGDGTSSIKVASITVNAPSSIQSPRVINQEKSKKMNEEDTQCTGKKYQCSSGKKTSNKIKPVNMTNTAVADFYHDSVAIVDESRAVIQPDHPVSTVSTPEESSLKAFVCQGVNVRVCKNKGRPITYI